MSKGLNKGFTLLELLVVIVIIGLLAGYVAPRYFGQVGRSEVQVARSQIEALEKALDQFRLDTRHYPSAEQGLDALVVKPANEANWTGPYPKKAVPNDPCGRAYVNRAAGAKRGALRTCSPGPAARGSSTSTRSARRASPAAAAKTPTSASPSSPTTVDA